MTRVRLRRIFRIVNGGTPTADESNWGGDVQWATPVDLARHDGTRIAMTDRTLTAAGLATGSRSVGSGSLIVSTRAPIGYVSETTAPMAFNQGCRGLEPLRDVDLRFFRYQLGALKDSMQSRGNGSTFVELSTDALAEVSLVVPPVAEQRAIADYLDAETARIDALIAKKQHLIHLLEERRWRIFDELSTVGSPDMVPLRRLLTFLTDGPFGSAFSSADYVDTGVAVIRLGNIGFAKFRGGELVYLPMQRLNEFARYQVRAGDLLVAGLGDDRNHGGRACVAPDLGPAIVKGKCFCGRVDARTADADYVALACSSPSAAERFRLGAQGSTRQMINLEIFRALSVPLPSVDRQKSIVAMTRREWTRLDQAVRALSGQIDLLAEHRQAVITRAVTSPPTD